MMKSGLGGTKYNSRQRQQNHIPKQHEQETAESSNVSVVGNFTM